jgi:cobalt-zinc-cadmium efflux system outer membrane protein
VTTDPRLGADAVRAQIAQPAARPGAEPRALPEPAWPPGVTLEDGVTEDEAVELALWNNAGFQAALAMLGFSRADLAQAGLLPNPTLSLLFPLGAKQLEFSVAFAADVLWLRPRRIEAARKDGARAAQALVQSGLDLVRDVRVASAELALAQERVRIAEAAQALRAEVGTIAQRRLALGDASELESVAAHVDALRAREEAVRAREAAQQAQVRWQTLLGLPLHERTCVLEAEAGAPDCAGDYAELWRQTLSARPDLRAAELGLEAAGARAGLATAEIFALTVILDANGSKGFEAGPGLGIALPLLSQNQGQRLRARAELERASASYAALVHAAHLELVAALGGARAAAGELRAVEQEIAPRVHTAVEQARAAYAAGSVPYLAVLEAMRQDLAVRSRASELAAESRRSCAELDRSIGRRVDELRPQPTAQREAKPA